jgi:predicted ester cyclase
MSKEDKNKAAIRRFSEKVWNKGNISIIPELIAPSFVFHTTPEIKGPEGIKQMVSQTRTAFSDYHETIDHIVAEGDMMAYFLTMQGTFTGEYSGIKPTGKKMAYKNALLVRFKDGKQVETWAYGDSITYYRQLGIPIPQQ